ncbi:Thromboxane-A synthase [Parelaphostrongylus tenuis]|uniref:Thromboxane-A synthase n=1 Tax=Parelaphostrongylus tenuis TaxID=148309 RepID=A0AAD5QHC2_PARTN|nr:Thromboxane-A synthase [Parelaphostrongylus tenuis]
MDVIYRLAIGQGGSGMFTDENNNSILSDFAGNKIPDIFDNICKKVDERINERSIDYETVVSMKYIDCLIKKSLRMYPLANVRVKEGEFVLVDTLSTHLNHNLWGEDADNFYPERCGLH